MKSRYIVSYTKLFFLPFLLLGTFKSQGQNSNLLNVNSLNGQGDINISSLIDRQIKYIQNSYSAKVEAPKEIINGKEYESYYMRSKNKPLLFPDRRRSATIFSKTRRYNNLTLQYDTFLDEVIYTDTSKTINYRFPQIALNKDVVEGFNLYFEEDSLTFRYFRLPECAKENLKEGFYEVAYQGKSKYVIKHLSSYYVKEGLNEYNYNPINYISVGEGYFIVKNTKAFLKLFGAKSGEVKKYLHISKIRIRRADKSEIVSVLKFYDSLLTSSR
jgi:hypothetical protein